MTTVTIKATQIVRHFLDDAHWIDDFNLGGVVRIGAETLNIQLYNSSAKVIEKEAIHYTTTVDAYDLTLNVRYESGEVAEYKLHR